MLNQYPRAPAHWTIPRENIAQEKHRLLQRDPSPADVWIRKIRLGACPDHFAIRCIQRPRIQRRWMPAMLEAVSVSMQPFRGKLRPRLWVDASPSESNGLL